jgi:SAM-dependent methyltransferase
VVALNLPGQYADDRNLRARQRLWRYQDPYFDVVAWVLDLAGLSPGLRVLDAGCGNGEYLRALARRPVHAAGCDLSMGMLRTAACPALLNADVAAENAAAWPATTRMRSPVPGPESSRTCARTCRP